MNRSPDLVVLGNLLVDDFVFADGTTRMGEAGGAVLYLALAARLCGLRVGVVSVRGDDYPEATLAALEERGVDLGGVRPLGRPGLRTWLLDEGRRRQVVHRLDGASHAEMSPSWDDVPEAWHGAPAFHLAPMPFELHRELLAAMADVPGVISLDPYELVRDDNLDAFADLLGGADVFLLGEDEMLADGAGALGRLASGYRRRPGPLRIVYKQGARGGVLRVNGTEARWTATPGAVDSTGAGDAFAAGFLAGLLNGGDRTALERGAEAARVAVSAPGTEALLAATKPSRMV